MVKYNLSPQATSFVGRTQEIAEITARITEENCRLLTLRGTGGIGKTRLALAVAERLLAHFADGAYFVGLQALTSAKDILSTIVDVLEIQLHDGSSTQEQLHHFLQNKEMLLVMDNFEHLLAGAVFLEDIILAAPAVKILVTSREALNLRSEWLYFVRGMSFPEDDEAIEAYSAVQLFEERAKQVQHDFAIQDEPLAVAKICRLVEGLPLGIELAAGWLKRLSCEDIAAEIERNIDILATDLHRVADRHRSIRAVFASSWKLLSAGERTIFMQLSIFRGGFTREAATQVTGASLFILSDLVDKSMLHLRPSGRYEIHNLLRQYGEEKLDNAPSVRQNAVEKHCEYYSSLLPDTRFFMRYGPSSHLRRTITLENENILLAWRYIIEHRKLSAVHYGLINFGLEYAYNKRETSQLLSQTIGFLRQEAPQSIVLGFALMTYGVFCRLKGDYEQALRYLYEGVDLLRRSNAEQELVWALNWLGITMFFKSDFAKARSASQEAFELSETIDDKVGMGSALTNFVSIARMEGHYNDAQRLGKRATELLKEGGDHPGYLFRSGYLAEIAQLQGEYSTARQMMKELLPHYIDLGSDWDTGQAYEFIGHIEHALGNYGDAEENLLESLRYAHKHGDPRRISFSLLGLGDLYGGMGQLKRAKRAYQEAIEIAEPALQRWQTTWALRGLGQITYYEGEYERSQRYCERSLEGCAEIHWVYGTVQANNVLGMVAVERKEYEVARHYFYKSLAANLENETPPVVLATILGIARLLAAVRQPEGAVELLSLILSDPKSHSDTKTAAQRLLADLQDEIGIEAFAAAVARGEKDFLERRVESLKENLIASKSSTLVEEPSDLIEALSEREIEVLHLVAAGKSNREIASELYLALGTVKTHVHNICGKLGASNRMEATATARDLGLL